MHMCSRGRREEEGETRRGQDLKESPKADRSGVKNVGFGFRQPLVPALALSSSVKQLVRI